MIANDQKGKHERKSTPLLENKRELLKHKIKHEKQTKSNKSVRVNKNG